MVHEIRFSMQKALDEIRTKIEELIKIHCQSEDKEERVLGEELEKLIIRKRELETALRILGQYER